MHCAGVLVLVSSDIHCSAHNSGIAVQIRTGRRKSVVAGVDAGRTNLQMEVTAGQICEARRIGEIISATKLAGHRYATVGEKTSTIINVCICIITEVVIHD